MLAFKLIILLKFGKLRQNKSQEKSLKIKKILKNLFKSNGKKKQFFRWKV